MTESGNARERRASRLLRRLLVLLPRRSRERYADELADVYGAILEDARRSGGAVGEWRRAMVLLADLGYSLATEYLDAWRAARCNPHRIARGCLAVAIAAWLLIFAVAADEARWAANLLNASLVLTMTITHGAPLLALALSRVRLSPYGPSDRTARLTGTAATVTFGGWAMLIVHLGQHAH